MLKEFALPTVFAPTKNINSVRIQSSISKAKVVAGMLIFLNLCLLISYIVGVNLQASSGFEIKNMQSKINNLNQANKQLNLNIAEKSSVANLEFELSSKDFIPVKTAIFLQEVNGLTMR